MTLDANSPDPKIAPREALSRLPAYAAGQPPQEIPGLTPYKLASNENPYAPVQAVREVIRQFADQPALYQYPETSFAQLRKKLGEVHGLDPQNINVGAGSLGALTQLIYTFAGTGEDGTMDEVIIPWRSFEAYPIVIRTAGAHDVQVPLLPDGRHDLNAMGKAITERTRMILLCTPNNPTGPVLTTAEVEEFLARVPQNIVVVIDEAYTEFIRDNQAVNGLEIFAQHTNVVVLRTFSKAHGLANLRIGYSVAHPEITQHLRTVATPFATSTLAEQAAIASLEHLDEVHSEVQKVVDERNRVFNQLRGMGYQVPDTQSNFVWLPLGESSQDFVAACATQALSVRGFGDEGVRVSIGEVEANDRLLAVAEEFSQRLS